MSTIVTVAGSTRQYPRKGEGDVIELRDGRVLLVYMEFAGDGSDFARTRFVAQESADKGLSWSKHRVVAETDAGDMNIFSPSLIRSSDGGILLIFMRQHGGTPVSSTMHLWTSRDEGQSFRPVTTFMPGGDFSLCNAVVKRLRSGRLMLPVTCAGLGGVEYAGTLLYSDDDGSTWRQSSSRVELPLRGVMEPHVEQTRDGRVLMVMRNQLGGLFMSESIDDGVTWSRPQTTALRCPESCPELTRIPKTGDLLMIWNNSEYDPAFASHFGKRSPLTAAVSKDEGRTWAHVRNIEDDPRRAYSNPGCRFTSSGLAVVNYWTCVYTEQWFMQDQIDLRVALLETDWFYGSSGDAV